jgi:hypothetical protein
MVAFKCQVKIEALTDEQARQRGVFGWVEVSVVALLLYNMRHVQEGAAQLNLLLGKNIDSAPRWVHRADSDRK